MSMPRLHALALVAALAACRGGAESPARPVTPLPAPAPDVPRVELGTWHGTSFGAYLAPKDPFLDDGGGFDLLFELNAGMMAEGDMRALGAKAVYLCMQNLGMGTTPYWDTFADQTHFGSLLSEATHSVQTLTGRKDAHIRRLGVVAWSAGYAAVQQILVVPRYYDQIGAVVLLDGLHTGYVKKPDGTPSKEADLHTLAPFVRYAEDAAAGKKVFVFTHTAIIPPDYASTTEVADALVKRLGATPDGDAFSLGNFHVLAHGGGAAKDHVDNLHLIDDVLTRWVLPRWK